MIKQIYNRWFSSDKEFIQFIKSITGYTPRNIKLYKQAFRHRSKYNDPADNNERLELLGDSILDAIVCDYLIKKYPYKEEGFITELRSKIVNRKSLNDVGARLGLVEKLQLNRKGIADVSKDLAGNTFEALVGAVYMDIGFVRTQTFIRKRVLQNLIDVEELQETDTDYKSKMYHLAQREGKTLVFNVTAQHSRNKRAYFVIELVLNGKAIAKGEGFSKKVAEQHAAMNALAILQNPPAE